ncbi:NADH-ubiquinone oxidoreductase complex I, 21 kDa subunit-domain-containing protein [Schizophyllum amplum]|uniref:NADH-ubiquinone oxidoreductase complex I, 21 kDa subunit-domain-containing protein n=1 Tax=Schizophyllum amplum TaxID=97359 RepID=A0A550CKH0_9AGAR|nr:NADH-ubiquinone oxidoreductase complex I, 21 kDa subunit-domain-containing protein [Auriculariopsis ampla]
MVLNKEVKTKYPLIDQDPHAARVIGYMRPSDLGVWGVATAAGPAAMYAWEAGQQHMPRSHPSQAMGMKATAFLGFIGGFMLAYQRSSLRFWGWTENKREEEMDFAELTQRAKEGKPLYGESDQPAWVQGSAFRNSVWTQLKFSTIPMFNFVHHSYHGTDPAKYGARAVEEESS